MLGLALVVGLLGLLLRPVLTGCAVVLGSFGLLVLGVLSQAVILGVAVLVAPNLDIHEGSQVLLISWAAAVVAGLVNWTLDAGSEDVFLRQLLGRATRQARRRQPSGDCQPGLLIIQLDGVGREVLQEAVTAGYVPTLARWLSAGTHTLRSWQTGLPATTPAGQAVLLYGDVLEVPSFRWFEKESGRLMVANHPDDAAELDRRLSCGDGLLADAGVSISTLLCGDAPTRLLAMSQAQLPPRRTRGLLSFATTRGGLVRPIVTAGGRLVTELFEGQQQRRRGVRPRVRRGLVFAAQRAVTTALLRDLTVAIVAEQIALATPVVFVGFIDYDEVAHHAGPTRPEAMRVLDGLDRILRFFAEVIVATGHHYQVVVVSDHGQAQGATFVQLSGESLEQVISSLAQDGPAPETMALVVAASGSLAHLYLTDVAGRACKEDIDHRYPRLINGLARHPQIGAILIHSKAQDSLVVLGQGGWRLLTGEGTSGGTGPDPVEVYGGRAAADLCALWGRRHVGDVVVLGRFDPVTGEVAAFEDLVGSHGGLGGGQTEALLLHPSAWSVPAGDLTGQEVHAALRGHLPRPGAP